MLDTLSNVDSYHAARGNTAWAAVDNPTRTAYILRASDWVSRSVRWHGEPVANDQEFAWPRKYVQYPDGTFVAEDLVPLAVRQAVAIVADGYRKGLDLDGQRAAGSLVKRKKIDVIETEFDTRLTNVKASPTDALELLYASGFALVPGEAVRT